MKILLDILVLVIILLYALKGWRRGFILSVFSIVGYFISLIMARAFAPKITRYLIVNTNVSSWVDNLLGDKLKNVTQINVPTNMVTGFATETILSVICFFIIFGVTSLIIFNIGQLANGVTRLPVVGKVNRFGGMVFGTIKGFLLAFIVLALLSFVVNIGNTEIASTIDNTVVVKTMYDNNPILYLISEVLEPIKNTLSSISK